MRDRSLGSTIRLKFTTTDANGAPVAPSSAFAASDFRIYKDGSATEKTTTNGITVTSPFDSVIGRHLIEIDTSNSTGDSGFWASGSAYFVELNTAKTVNSQTVSGLEIGSFSLELQTSDVRKFGGIALTQSGGRPEVNATHLAGTSQTARDIGASVLLSNGTGTGQIKLASGYVAPNWGDVANPTTTVALTNTTISTSQTITSVSGAVGSVSGNVSGSVASVVAGVTVTTNNDKTGYSLTAGTGLGNQTANITGNLSGSVGSVTSAVTVGTINANAITASALATDAVDEIADGVWDEATSGHTTAGTYGGRIVRATNSNVEVQITGSNHIAADVHEFQNGVIEATDFAAGAITSTVIAADAITSSQLAASAVTEIQSGLATTSQLTTVEGKIDTIDNYVDTEVAAIKATTDKLDTTVELDGAVYRFTTNALEQAPIDGDSTDWTANERTAIRTILGIPGAGTTPADPVDGVLYDIKQKTDQIGSVGAITSLLAGAVLEPGTITSFPEIITIGDSYTVQNGRSINIPIVDTDGNPISTTGSLNFADATAYFTISRANETDPARIITGTATFVDPPGTGTSAAETPYARIELSSSETSKGLLKYKYSGVLTFVWPGTGTETMSFETETITFDN